MTDLGKGLRRSFIWREIEAEKPQEVGEVAGATVVLKFQDGEQELARAKRLGVADLSTLPRTGFKGSGTVEWLRKSGGLDVPDKPNRSVVQKNGAIAARLSDSEVLLLESPFSPGGEEAKLAQAWRDGDGKRGYPLPRRDSHVWFVITGESTAEMFAKVCGVNLGAAVFPEGAVAQTSVARATAVVVRHDLGGTCAMHLLADSASAGYLWGCLLDAAKEFNGGPVGLHTLEKLAKMS